MSPDTFDFLEGVAYEFPLESWTEQPGSKVRALSYARALQELLLVTWFADRSSNAAPNRNARPNTVRIIGETGESEVRRRSAA